MNCTVCHEWQRIRPEKRKYVCDTLYKEKTTKQKMRNVLKISLCLHVTSTDLLPDRPTSSVFCSQSWQVKTTKTARI
jgi:hypothetical protein